MTALSPPAGSIGFLNDQILQRDRAGTLSCDHAFVRFLLAFRRRYERVVLFSRVDPAIIDAPRSVLVDGEGIEVVELPFYPRISSLFSHPLRYWPDVDVALRRVDDLDALWLNTGHPISLRALRRVGGRSRPLLCAALRGNYEQDAAIREGGAARAARVMQTAMMWLFARAARRHDVPVLAYGDAAVARSRELGMRAIPFETTLLSAELVARPPSADPAFATDVLVICRLVQEKGLDRLLDAMPSLRGRDGAPARLAIVGDGPQRAVLERQVDDLGLRERVVFRGYVGHGPGLMAMVRSARVFALPSRTEGVPGTALEAMAMRVPVVATAVGGLPTLLGEGRGLLVAADEADLAGRFGAALQRALDDDALREGVIEAAFAHVRGLTMEGQVDRVVALLEGARGQQEA